MHQFSQFDKCMYFYRNCTPPKKKTEMQKYNSQKNIKTGH